MVVFFKDRVSCVAGWLRTDCVAEVDLEVLVPLPSVPPHQASVGG